MVRAGDKDGANHPRGRLTGHTVRTCWCEWVVGWTGGGLVVVAFTFAGPVRPSQLLQQCISRVRVGRRQTSDLASDVRA